MKKWRTRNAIRRLERPAMVLASAAGLTALLMSLEFNLLEANLYDFRMARGMLPDPNPEIVLVTLDDDTTKGLGEFAPLPLDFHARFVEQLEKLSPKAVGYLVDMNRVNQMNPLLFREEWGSRFVEAAQRMENRGTSFLMGTPFDVTGELVPPYPLSSLPHSIAIIHKDGNVFAEDKITRRALTYLYDKPVFHVDLAQRLNHLSEGSSPKGSFYVPEVDGQYFFFKYHGSTAISPSDPTNLAYPHVSFADVLNGLPSADLLRNKIVLVGSLTREDSSDYAFTPFSKNSFTNPKLVVHANILDAAIHEDSIVRVPNWFNWVTTFSLTTYVLWWVLNTSPLSGVFTTLGLATGFGLLAQVLFSFKGWWIRESQPLVGIFLAYYLAVPYRLILEYKQRWDYQRKHEILVQVEELKTNFLQLVTHDLKTPVARIQGLAEMLLRSPEKKLSERDQSTISHIVHSTEELNRFISSILELHKVESNRLHLRLESKDINQLIERAAESFRAQARSNGIDLLVDLDPLFPIRIDTALIAKVINNLIDNALKYSPAGSEVRIRSAEEGDWVVISVSDEGIGMTEEERANLFTRFYRAKNDTTSQVSGTGLGLYLTKFFVEAHQGRVDVQSESGKGSTFKIMLPLVSVSLEEITGAPAESKPGLTRLWAFNWQKKKENVNV